MTFSVEIVTTGGVRALSDVDVHKNNNLSGVEIYNMWDDKRAKKDKTTN
uniref:Uncharacterized protein n=1 Tax=Meloidogyne enterolobii TaxID=390850 RepID=A0A6V7Y6C3_MELEN|nr:unnamed protein product [Meloidogyne enterolobii]